MTRTWHCIPGEQLGVKTHVPKASMKPALPNRTTAGKLLLVLFATSAILQLGCEKTPPLIAYRDGGLGLDRVAAPIVIVGQILEHKVVGPIHPSHWYPNDPIQLNKVTVRVENILNGDTIAGVVPVYYIMHIREMGHARMGMVGRGGHWQIGDRAIFFLRRDSGVLRTIFDTWASATPPVLTGPHPDYKPRPNEPLSNRIIDILLDRGQPCDETQWAHSILTSTSQAEHFDLAYTVRKLRQIAATYTPEARQAAEGELDDLSYSWPKIREGWPF